MVEVYAIWRLINKVIIIKLATRLDCISLNLTSSMKHSFVGEEKLVLETAPHKFGEGKKHWNPFLSTSLYEETELFKIYFEKFNMPADPVNLSIIGTVVIISETIE